MKKLLITDSISKYVSLNNQPLEITGLPGKEISYVTHRTEKGDEYNLRDRKVIVLHLGAVNILKWLSGERPDYTIMRIMYQYQDLHKQIRSINNKAVIVFSGVIPMPGLQKHGSETIVKTT